jgi:hypothetical protein
LILINVDIGGCLSPFPFQHPVIAYEMQTANSAGASRSLATETQIHGCVFRFNHQSYWCCVVCPGDIHPIAFAASGDRLGELNTRELVNLRGHVWGGGWSLLLVSILMDEPDFV